MSSENFINGLVRSRECRGCTEEDSHRGTPTLSVRVDDRCFPSLTDGLVCKKVHDPTACMLADTQFDLFGQNICIICSLSVLAVLCLLLRCVLPG